MVKKVRKIVRLFRKSPVKNEKLQKYVVEEKGKEMMLIIDCKTRWNSLHSMLERFVELKSAVHKALIDIGEKTVKMVEEWEMDLIEEMVRCLNILKLGAESVCRRDCGLLEAEAAVRFMLTSLLQKSSDMAQSLAEALIRRIKQRRSRAAAVLQSLHTCMREDTDENFKHIFPSATKREVQDFVTSNPRKTW